MKKVIFPFFVLLAFFAFYYFRSPDRGVITQERFEALVKDGRVARIIVIANKKEVEVHLNGEFPERDGYGKESPLKPICVIWNVDKNDFSSDYAKILEEIEVDERVYLEYESRGPW